MSGRSAHVRAEKKKVKSVILPTVTEQSGLSGRTSYDAPYNPRSSNTLSQTSLNGAAGYTGSIASGHSGGNIRRTISPLTGTAYARATEPIVPFCDGSAIERSHLRKRMDEFSENSRNFLSGKPIKKDNENAPPNILNSVHVMTPQKKQFFKPLPEDILKSWSGGGQFPRKWSHMKVDLELWDEGGDALVYLGNNPIQGEPAQPMCRVHSDILRATGADEFLRLLSAGKLGDTPDGTDRGSYRDSYSYTRSQSRSDSRGRSQVRNSGVTRSSGSSKANHDFEVYIPMHDGLLPKAKMKEMAKYRNIISKLHGKSVVGYGLQEALLDTRMILDDSMPRSTDNALEMIAWVTSIALHDVSYDPGTACEVLAWSEKRDVRWLPGWRETFVHCVGMFERLKFTPQYKLVSHRTKTMLERAHFEVEKRMDLAQEVLTAFTFTDMWHDKDPSMLVSQSCFENFRKFIIGYFTKACGQGCWPPKKVNGNPYWLTRTLIQRLVDDFGALYEFLVDRDIMWESAEDVSNRDSIFVSYGATDTSKADPVDVLIRDVLVGLDTEHGWPRVPHPYPHLPPTYRGPESHVKEKKRLFSSSKSQKDKIAKEKAVKNADHQATLSYKRASNVMEMGEIDNDLLNEFIEYEISLNPRQFDPRQARRGHWFLIYAVMQILATVSVDTPGLAFGEDVTYPLCCRMEEDGQVFEPIPNAWKDLKGNNSHKDSFCWVVPKSWKENQEDGYTKEGGDLAVGMNFPGSDAKGVPWPSSTNSGTGTGYSTGYSGRHGHTRESTTVTDPSSLHSSVHSSRPGSRLSVIGEGMSKSPNRSVRETSVRGRPTSYEDVGSRGRKKEWSPPKIATSKTFPIQEDPRSESPMSNSRFARQGRGLATFTPPKASTSTDETRSLESTHVETDDVETDEEEYIGRDDDSYDNETIISEDMPRPLQIRKADRVSDNEDRREVYNNEF